MDMVIAACYKPESQSKSLLDLLAKIKVLRVAHLHLPSLGGDGSLCPTRCFSPT